VSPVALEELDGVELEDEELEEGFESLEDSPFLVVPPSAFAGEFDPLARA